MAYTPISNGIWVPEIAGNNSAWQSIIDNDAELYANGGTLYASAYGPFVTGSGGAAYTACWFALPANHDDLTYEVTFAYTQTGTSATVKLTVTDGSATDHNTTTVTASGPDMDTVTVAPSNTSASSTPRYGYLELTAANTKTLTLAWIFVSLVPAAARSGVLPSGYISVDSSWYTASAPIPVEILQTLNENPFRIAADRPTAFLSVIRPSEAADRGLATNTSDFVTVTFVTLPTMSTTKTYRIWCYVERSSTAKADVVVFMGSTHVIMFDDHGVMTTTFEAGSFDLNGTDLGNVVKIRVSSGSGYVALRTLQLLEEPT